MTDCPHEHEPDTGRQTFRDIIREETDGGRSIARFLTNAMFDKDFMFKDEPWNYMYTVHGDTIKANTFASDGHDPFIYDSDLGRYVPADERLRPFLADSMKHEWSPARVDLILNWYRDRSTKLWDPPPLDRVNVLNGILDIASGDLQPHSPDFLSPIQINAAWDPEADCPAIDRFVQRVFPYDAQEVFYQLAGLFLTPDSRRQKAVLFLGSGASGKSVATALLRTFLGHWNVSNVPLHDLTEGSFSLAELRGKLLNISADVPERDFNDTAIFKQIVDGQLATLRAPRKHRDPIEFQPFTRLLASAGRVPQSADNSLGYLRRWLVVPFDTSLNESTPRPRSTRSAHYPGRGLRPVKSRRRRIPTASRKRQAHREREDGPSQRGVRPGIRLHTPLPQRASRGMFPIRRDRPHRGVRRLQGLVRLQPFQPRKRPSLLRLHLGHLQNQNGKKQRPQAVQGHPTCRRKNVSGRGQGGKGRSRAGMISRKRPASQSWTESVLALGRARRAQRARFLKNFSLQE